MTTNTPTRPEAPVSEERTYAYIATGTGTSRAYLQISNDGQHLSIVAAYIEDGSAVRENAAGRATAITGRVWGSRILSPAEATLERASDGTIERVVDIALGVRLTDVFEDVTGPHRTRAEALDAAAHR